MIWRGLLRRKSRTLLTLLSIVIGVAAMIALGALGAGLASGYQSVAGGSQADLVISQADAYDFSLSSVDEDIGRQLEAMPEVSDAAGMLMGNVSAAEGAKYFFVFGHDPQSFTIDHFKVVRGQGLDARGIRGRPLLLGELATEALEVDVGDTLNLTGGTFRVVGVYETGDAFEDGAAVVSLKDAQAMLQKPRLVNAFYIKLKDASLAERLETRVGRLYSDVAISTAAEFADKQQAVQMMEGFASAVAIMAILVGGISMANTVLMSVYERTREIGVLRALGWRRRRVLGLILGESLLLALLGTAFGVLVGVFFVYAIRNVPLYGIMRGQYSADLFIRAFVVAMLLGVFGGLYPAWRASQLQPLEAMRYDGSDGNRNGNGRQLPSIGGMTLRSLMRRKTRTLLTLLAIGVGIGSVVGLGGIMASMSDQFGAIAGGSNAHLMAIEANVSDLGYSAIPESVGTRLAAHPDIAHVSGVVVGFSMEMEDVPFFIMMGYHPQEKATAHFKIVDGQPLQANRQTVLGRSMADAINKKVGDTVRVGNSSYRVVGIFETGAGYEEMGGLFTRRDVQAFSGKPRQVNWYAIELEDPQDADLMLAYLEENFPQIDVSLTSEFAESLPDMESANAMMGGIAVLMALVGSVGMTNTILMSVLERTREFGVLRALGWSRRRILFMVLKESLLLGALGGLAGILIGILLARLIGAIPAIGEMVGNGQFDSLLLFRAMLVALVLGALGGLYPAWRATRMSPIEALRYE